MLTIQPVLNHSTVFKKLKMEKKQKQQSLREKKKQKSLTF